MAITFDAGGTTGITRTDTSNPMTWTHTPSGTPRGAVVGFMHGASTTDHVQSVTWGGVNMTRIVRAVDTATEPGAAELWFLGTGIPTGLQTISASLASATTDDILSASFVINAASDTQVIDYGSIQEDAANPTVTLRKFGRSGGCIAAMYGGGAAPGGTLATGCTLERTADLGNFMAQTCRETTPNTSDFTIGWSTLTSDDLAFVAICVAEARSDVPGLITEKRTARRRTMQRM